MTFSVSRRRLRAVLFFALLFCAVSTADAQTMFVADFDGQQSVPPNNSAGRGFGVVVLNEAEDEIRFIAEYSGLSAPITIGTIYSSVPGQNFEATIGGISFSHFQTSGTSVEWAQTTTPEQVQWLKSGLWYFKISSAAFPNGEIRGKVLPYSPYIANLSGAQVVPPVVNNGSGRALFALDKSGRQAVVWLKYQNPNWHEGIGGIIDNGLSGTNGTPEFNWFVGSGSEQPPTLQFLRAPHHGLTEAQSAALKAGRLYLRFIRADGQGGTDLMRGQIKRLDKFADFNGDNRATSRAGDRQPAFGIESIRPTDNLKPRSWGWRAMFPRIRTMTATA